MDHERAASMIGDYALDRLGDDDRREIDEHLERCPDCRDLLDQARELREVLPGTSSDTLLAHVQSAHLTRFVRDPRSLERRLSTWIEEHLQSCAPCREAVEILREIDSGGAAEEVPVRAGTPPERVTPWGWLARTLLHPAPALAYLVLLVAVVGLWIGGRESAPTGPAVEVLPEPFKLYPAETFRGGQQTEPAPVDVPVLPAGEDLWLWLHTEIDDAILEDDRAAFLLAVSEGSEIVARRNLSRSELSDYGVLRLRLRGLGTRPGGVYRFEVRLDQPDSPRHEEILFERSLRLPSADELPRD